MVKSKISREGLLKKASREWKDRSKWDSYQQSQRKRYKRSLEAEERYRIDYFSLGEDIRNKSRRRSKRYSSRE